MRFCAGCAYDFWGAAAGREEQRVAHVAEEAPAGASGYQSIPRPLRAVIGGGALVALGSLLPWITTSSVDGTWANVVRAARSGPGTLPSILPWR
jgi:hypothetical protein